MRVFHVLPTLVYGDAVGNDARARNTILLELGWRSRLYAARTIPAFAGTVVHSIEEMPQTNADDIIIYHLSTGDALNESIAKMPGHKLIIYHNITPPEFFAPYNALSYQLTKEGYAQTRAMAPFVDYCMAVSSYNAQDLRRMGYTCPIDVVPVLIPFADYEKTPDEAVMKKYSDGRTNVIFVGRIAPNKRQEDVVRAFACYKERFDPTARLFVVGSHGDREDTYWQSLKHYTERLGVADVIFPGHIKFEEILAYYHVADLFVSMSDHEGFCVPLVEAMFFNVPILAKDTSAIANTLGGSGLLLPDADPVMAATAMHRVRTDEVLRTQLLAGQQRRLQDFGYETIKRQFTESFEKFLAHTKATGTKE